MNLSPTPWKHAHEQGMTDAEWLDTVESYALEFGQYVFCASDRNRVMGMLTNGPMYNWLNERFWADKIVASLATTFEITTEAREGIARRVALKLEA